MDAFLLADTVRCTIRRASLVYMCAGFETNYAPQRSSTSYTSSVCYPCRGAAKAVSHAHMLSLGALSSSISPHNSFLEYWKETNL